MALDDRRRSGFDSRQVHKSNNWRCSVGHWINFMETPVNGLKFNVPARYLRTLTKKATVELVREQNNEHDPNAVAVVHNDTKLGYIPASIVRTVASLIDGGFPLRAHITLVEPAGPVVMVVIAINDRE